MTRYNKDSASFLEFFRSVNFAATRASAPVEHTSDRQFYVPHAMPRATAETSSEELNLVRSYN